MGKVSCQRRFSSPCFEERGLFVAGTWMVAVTRSVVWGGRTEAGPVCATVYCASVPYHDPPEWEDMARSRGHKPLMLL